MSNLGTRLGLGLSITALAFTSACGRPVDKVTGGQLSEDNVQKYTQAERDLYRLLGASCRQVFEQAISAENRESANPIPVTVVIPKSENMEVTVVGGDKGLIIVNTLPFVVTNGQLMIVGVDGNCYLPPEDSLTFSIKDENQNTHGHIGFSNDDVLVLSRQVNPYANPDFVDVPEELMLEEGYVKFFGVLGDEYYVKVGAVLDMGINKNQLKD